MLPVMLLSANLMIGDCLAWSSRPEGWPVTYKIERIQKEYFEVKPLLASGERDRTPNNKPWYKTRIDRRDRDYEKVVCPL